MAPSMNRSPKKKAAKGFVYKERSYDDVKRRAERSGGNFDSILKAGFDSFKPHDKLNSIRILPPTWDDHEHYAYEVFMHGYVGTNSGSYVCLQKMLNKKCPICVAAKEAKDAGDEEEFKALRVTSRFLCYIVDRKAEDPDAEVPIIWSMSFTMDKEIADQSIDKKKGKLLHLDNPDEGYDVNFRRTGTTATNTKYTGVNIDRENSPLHDDEGIQEALLEFAQENPIPDILLYQSQEYLEGIMSGSSEEKDEDLEDEKPKRRKRDEADEEEAPRRGRRADKEDAEEEEEPPRRRKRDEPEEEDDGEPAPKKRSKRDEPEDEEEPPRRRARRDEPEDEEEPAPKKRRAAEPDEEEEPAPKKRSRRDGPEDEEEEPKGKVSRVKSSRNAEPDEEEEEAPRKKRRAEPDEEEEEEAPRRSRR